MTRSVANVIAGRGIKYVFVVFWIAVFVGGAMLSNKLTGVEKNDSKSWLPGGAESVQVIDVSATFTSPNTIPAVVVYERPGGLTEADLRKMRDDAAAFGRTAELDGQVVGPIPTQDNQAAQTIVPLDLGSDGWAKAGDLVVKLREVA